MAKYYAVKVGRETGIFHSWEACREQVEGYSGADYQSFSTLEEAQLFLKNGRASEAITIYIDGSYKESVGLYSYGCVILNPERETLSGVGTDRADASLRNVAGELLGAMKAVEWACGHHYEAVVLYHDYSGLAKWASGEWTARTDQTREYVAFLDQYRKRMDISFVKVEAHSGNRYNDEADRLAKQALADYAANHHS
ncbi:MAG TPA: ribonuclease H family protein [Bacillales bacterium]|nr:ribonuclease H family protein [Bacillales bacterium]